MFTVFYGVGWVLRGYLIFRSGYLPKILGVLMTLGGLAFITRNFLLVLTPADCYRVTITDLPIIFTAELTFSKQQHADSFQAP
jgi:hypothetical protein